LTSRCHSAQGVKRRWLAQNVDGKGHGPRDAPNVFFVATAADAAIRGVGGCGGEHIPRPGDREAPDADGLTRIAAEDKQAQHAGDGDGRVVARSRNEECADGGMRDDGVFARQQRLEMMRQRAWRQRKAACQPWEMREREGEGVWRQQRQRAQELRHEPHRQCRKGWRQGHTICTLMTIPCLELMPARAPW
jgi:hypothetical protein